MEQTLLKVWLINLQLSDITTFSISDRYTINGNINDLDMLLSDMRFILGVELLYITDTEKYHMLGCRYDPNNEKLQSLLTLGK